MAKGKFKDLFKKKEGGSVIGNALRFVGDKFTGGTYSSLFPKPTDADIERGTKLVTSTSALPSNEDQEFESKMKAAEAEKKLTTKTIAKYVGIGIGAVALLIGLYKLFTKKK
ncbi:MAG: hypothetical protein ACK479_12225 [Fluviicola sp.]